MTNNKQQTAVEWFAKKTFNQIELLKHLCINEEQFLNNMLIFRDQAKEMEKQQIINCYNQSWHFRDKPYETAEKYYNETFGK